MFVGTIGINFKTSKLDCREQLAHCLRRLSFEEPLVGTVVITTCNRIEIYFSGECLAEKHSAILDLVVHHVGDGFLHEFYTYFSYECFYHLAKVTSGIDSAVFGESEIQRQIKTAYAEAAFRFNLVKDLHFLFQKSLKIGKRLRSLGIEGVNKWSLEQAICENIHQWGGQEPWHLLLIGNSQINRKMIAFFDQKPNVEITLCSKTPPQKKEVLFLPRSQLSSLASYDVVIAGTHADDYVIDPSHLEGTSHPLLIFDLGVPRNIAPCLSEEEVVTLKTLEELQQKMLGETCVSTLFKKRYEQELETCVRRHYHSFKKNRSSGKICAFNSCIVS